MTRLRTIPHDGAPAAVDPATILAVRAWRRGRGTDAIVTTAPAVARVQRVLDEMAAWTSPSRRVTIAETGGDPRGYALKLHLPSGKGNTWGGDECGWGVPS